MQSSLEKLQSDDAGAALADFDVEKEMHDVEDGLLFRRHPRLGREGAIHVRDEHGKEHRVVKLCFIAYLDGIETANPLGVARGSHSTECVYVALLNLPLTMRYRMEIGEYLPGHAMPHVDAQAFRHACGDRRERRRR